MIDPARYVHAVTLRDGTVATLRSVRKDDADKIRRAFHQLSSETVYTRFFGYRTEVSDSELRRICDVDFIHDAALLVTLGTGDEEIVIGGASAFAVDRATPPAAAELAFTVEEDYQGKGIASLLLHHIVDICRGNGVARLEADVLTRNTAMLEVFEHAGLPMTLRHEGETVRVVMTLQPEASARPS